MISETSLWNRRRRCAYKASLLAVVALLLWPVDAFGRKPIRQLTAEEAAQVWVGFSDNELYLFRLHLQQDGSGRGGYLFAGQQATNFRISSWTYEGKRIELIVAPADIGTVGFSVLRGELVGTNMEVTIYGEKWKRHLSLRPEAELERRWLMLREAMSSATN